MKHIAILIAIPVLFIMFCCGWMIEFLWEFKKPKETPWSLIKYSYQQLIK